MANSGSSHSLGFRKSPPTTGVTDKKRVQLIQLENFIGQNVDEQGVKEAFAYFLWWLKVCVWFLQSQEFNKNTKKMYSIGIKELY